MCNKAHTDVISNFIDIDASVFENRSPNLITLLSLCSSLDALSVQHFEQRLHCFWTWKTTKKTCVLPIFQLSKRYSQNVEVYLAFSSTWSKILCRHSVFWSLLYVVITKLQMEQHTLALDKTLLNYHICYSHITRGKWHTNTYCTCT